MTTRSLPALKAFLAGERHFRAGEYEGAIEDYEGAIEADSAFALAHARRALSMDWAGGSSPPRRWRRAYELSEDLPVRERAVVWAFYMQRVRGRSVVVADSLRRLTELYPDDPSLWNAFGETLFHGLVPGAWPETEEAFERAVELDAGVASYHRHLVDLAIAAHHDSATTARRLDAYPDEQIEPVYRLIADVVFGTERTRRLALERVDSVAPIDRYFFYHPLGGPLGGEPTAQLWSALRRSGVEPDRPPPVNVPVRQGHLENVLDRVREGTVWRSHVPCLLALGSSVGLPYPDSVVRRHLDPATLPERADVPDVFCTGVHAVDRKSPEAASRMLERLDRAAGASSERAERPGGRARTAKAAADQLRGYRAWRSGAYREAESHWSKSKPPAYLAWSMLASLHSNLWRGDLYRELGELERAAAWYLAAWRHPVAHERLGRVYEEMGRREDAVASYRRFVAAWEDADEPLQDRVERARERLEVLSGEGADDA